MVTVERERCTLSRPAENSIMTPAAGSNFDRQLTTFQIKKVPPWNKKTAGETRLLSVINKTNWCTPLGCANGSDERIFVSVPSVPVSKDRPPPRSWRQAVIGQFLDFHYSSRGASPKGKVLNNEAVLAG